MGFAGFYIISAWSARRKRRFTEFHSRWVRRSMDISARDARDERHSIRGATTPINKSREATHECIEKQKRNKRTDQKKKKVG